MNSRINQLLVGSDSRYLNEEERKEISEYMRAFESRMQMVALIEENEDAAVRFCIDNTRKRYPNF